MSKCSVESCNEEAVARGLCARHYQQVRRHGVIKGNGNKGRCCSVESCNEEAYSRGLCRKHYNALRWKERKLKK